MVDEHASAGQGLGSIVYFPVEEETVLPSFPELSFSITKFATYVDRDVSELE